MKKFSWIVPIVLALSSVIGAAESMECGSSPAMKEFASTLNAANRVLFCTKFDEAQRGAAMSAMGDMTMTPDQAVEKIASDNNMMPQKTSGGCPKK